MPSTIPYHPSLTLLSVVNEETLDIVAAISKLQEPVDAAQHALNSIISSQNSLLMTKVELKNLGADTSSLDKELEKLSLVVAEKGAAYAAAKMTAEPQIAKLQGKIHSVQTNVESPVDNLRSQIKTMPLASDSVNMDVQYFAFDANSQNAGTFSSQIASYIASSVGSVFGASTSTRMGAAASSQVVNQIASHAIQGTLVFCVSCTHKNASIVAPFTLQIDKSIKLWNRLFPGKKLDPTSSGNMLKLAINEGQEEKEKFSIVSGTTFGSTFVGMVHVLAADGSSVSEAMFAAAASLQATMDVGAWFNDRQGRAGIDSNFARDLENLLNQQNVQSRVTLLTMGVTPFAAAKEVKTGADDLTTLSTEETVKTVKALQNANTSQFNLDESQENTIKFSLGAFANNKNGEDKVLDAESLVAALDDYLAKAADGNVGLPINYYLKDIDQKMLAEMWVAKYYPSKYMSLKYNDTKGTNEVE